MEYFYIRKNIRRPAVFGVQLSNNVGIYEPDYKAGKWVEITQQQADFYTQNPYASFSEIMAMEMTTPPIVEIPIEEQYKNLVISKIREEYSVDDELAIQRKRDIDTVKFSEYNTFCEQCKSDAKQELNLL